MNFKKFGLLAFMLIVLLAVGCSTASAYSRQTAVNYALKWVQPGEGSSSYNNNQYHPFESDCTNYISQCLYVGGWNQVGRYDALSPDSWYYVYYSWPSSLCVGFSRTWTVADSFYNFCSRHQDRAQPISVKYNQNLLEKGDIIQMDGTGSQKPDGRWDHSLIITEKGSGGVLKVSSHTNNLKNDKFSDIQDRNPNARYIGWHIK